MKTMIKYGLITIFMTGLGFSQLEETLESMAKDNAKGYLGPIVTAMGMGVNSGTFHTAKPHSVLGFDFKLGVSLISITDAGKTFDFVLPDANISVPLTLNSTNYTVSINPDEIYSTDRTSSTVFGEKSSNQITVNSAVATDKIANQLAAEMSGVDAATVKALYGTQIASAISSSITPIKTPEGFNLSALPMAVPQMSLGLPMSIEITLRGTPEIDLGDLGKMTFLGYGGKIGLNQFIPIPNIALPRVSVGYYMTNLELGEMMSFKNSIATLQVSKSIPFLTVYGGFGLESSTLDVDYTYADELTSTEVPVKFSIDGENTFRTTVGGRLKLAFLTINADYNIGELNAINVGVGLTLR